MTDDTPLARILRERIVRDGPISVRDFMQAALHDPELGYYAKGRDIGARGDFYTSANVSLFPGALVKFIQGAIERMGEARIIELGGGTGALAQALGTPVTVVEPNEGMARAQRQRGLDVVASLGELPPAPTVFVANEVLDALPVHRILMTEEGPREGHVAWQDGRFVEVPGPLTRPELGPEARRLALPPGCAAEVNLDVRALLAQMARAAPVALALFLDYGGEPHELYGEDHKRGTMRGYHEHRVVDALERPGAQDMTADVEFTLVEAQARDAGFDVLGRRPQGAFLADLGLVDDMQAALTRGDTDAYLAAKNLLFPGGMGARFKALGLARGIANEPPLPGFRPDIMPGLGWR